MPPGHPPQKTPRPGLPYGAVMATGASSQLAGLCGVHAAAAPLLWLTIVEAVGIAVLGIVRRRAHGRVRLASWLWLGAPGEHMGELTVPLGLAVTATGLAAQRGAFASSLLPVCCVLASLAAVALVARVLAAVAISGRRLEAVDGGWFLTPAVLSRRRRRHPATMSQAEEPRAHHPWIHVPRGHEPVASKWGMSRSSSPD